jgi:hypothetical protein
VVEDTIAVVEIAVVVIVAAEGINGNANAYNSLAV